MLSSSNIPSHFLFTSFFHTLPCHSLPSEMMPSLLYVTCDYCMSFSSHIFMFFSHGSHSLFLFLPLSFFFSLGFSALKAVPFTARSGKRSSRLFCDSGFSDDSPS